MNNLPIEMLASVFKNLRQRDLLNVALVCHQFKSAIDEFNLIKTMHIRGDERDIPSKNDDSWAPKRKYSEAIVSYFKPRTHLLVIESCGERLLAGYTDCMFIWPIAN